MNSIFTQDLSKLEEYSLAMIDFFDKLPDSFFDDESLEPPQRIVDSILQYSKNHQSSSLYNGTKLFRWGTN
ncbi:hypothetical protein [Saccharicrinis fermentans]|uniref:Uncharacterized protein n=1 Tax=Saccharicrinis fermentans DSM 9555 = JCM 21142 TaxID=869213 RepID=W7YIJ7_9BACT|nr:hypothetical protein [Saccharicrinis fermentans]GAF02364.1 hypothetical protein JCM21142_3998 [Saccharicrinis fermentans DSM 9555 = JCM 21142]